MPHELLSIELTFIQMHLAKVSMSADNCHLGNLQMVQVCSSY